MGPRLVPLAGVAAVFRPETSCAPEIHYEPPTITFDNHEDQHVRASFERWDGLRVCRGEYLPYALGVDRAAFERGAWPSCFVVQDSPWLAERYAYEKEHYGRAYNFGGNVDEMLTDFEHYVLHFHDEFVEAVAGGIWFELSDTPFTRGEWQPDHPLLGLGTSHIVETSTYRGIGYEIRRNPLPLEALKQRALLCTQPLLAFVSHLGSRTETDLSVGLRERSGRTVCICRGLLGVEQARLDRVPTVEEIRPQFLAHLDKVVARRKAMGIE